GGPCVAYRSQSRCCCCPFSSISCGSRLRLELPSFPTRRSSDLPARIAGMQKRIDEAAQEAGRDPGDIRRAYNVMGMIMDGVSERSEEHTSELQSREKLVCRLLLEKKTQRTVAVWRGRQTWPHRL